MGGQTSEVSETTTEVLLESASFTRGGILQTARRLDLHSEASHRFERGTDPEGLEIAAARAAKLMTAWAGGRTDRGVAAAGEVPTRRWTSMRPARASALLGYEVTDADAIEVFDVLHLTHRTGGDRIEVEVPGYRTDLEGEVDLIEEVLRIQGYDRVGSALPRSPQPGSVPAEVAFVARAKDALLRAGLREIRPVPFASQSDLDLFGDTDAVPIANPLRAEEGFLRTRLTPGLLHAVARNVARGTNRIALFEVGTTFRLADPFREQRKLGFVLTGAATEGWSGERRDLDVLDATGVLDAVLDDLGIRGWSLAGPAGPPFHPGRSATIAIGDTHGGVIGEIHPRVAAELEIEQRVAVCVVGLSPLMAAADTLFVYRDVPRLPPVRRDLAFVVPIDVPAGAFEAALREAGEPRLDRCVLFDVFTGGGLEPGTRSLAYAIELRDPARTLTDAEATETVDRMVEAVAQRFGARLRAA
jgi:phenylalanyl-tRNA synthetase beta chain